MQCNLASCTFAGGKLRSLTLRGQANLPLCWWQGAVGLTAGAVLPSAGGLRGLTQLTFQECRDVRDITLALPAMSGLRALDLELPFSSDCGALASLQVGRDRCLGGSVFNACMI